ncbi:hypothetical protein EUC06_20950 [Salmonella enterica subsp. enterica serovar Enteritidis]|nr:hypothetical protein [Salmonella enterica subsp. enterica serovar Enteritidis]ECD0323873.1 hypothetical protein [Salmonella enterica subsp. enterica serovar Enteritidis]
MKDVERVVANLGNIVAGLMIMTIRMFSQATLKKTLISALKTFLLMLNQLDGKESTGDGYAHRV